MHVFIRLLFYETENNNNKAEIDFKIIKSRITDLLTYLYT